MDDFGFEAVNDGGTATVSSNTRLLVFSERGTVRIRSAYSDKPGYGSVTLQKPIRTMTTPEIFVRVQSHNRDIVSVYFTFIGGPGNWTGFKITAAAGSTNNLIDHTLEFVACKYSDSPSAETYGMEFYSADGSGDVLFNSTDKPVIFDRFTKLWQYAWSGSSYIDIYKTGITMAVDDFVSVSGFDRGLVFFGDADYAGLRLISGNARVIEMTVNHHPTQEFRDPIMGTAFNYCAPICKFPASIYHN